jgi:hypothetical protein
LSLDSLLKQQNELLQQLREVNRQLGAIGFLSSNIDCDPSANLAKFYADDLMRRGLSIGELGQVEYWFKYHLERQVRREAKRQAEWDIAKEAKERLDTLKRARASG